jgi:hypothetical protein
VDAQKEEMLQVTLLLASGEEADVLSHKKTPLETGAKNLGSSPMQPEKVFSTEPEEAFQNTLMPEETLMAESKPVRPSGKKTPTLQRYFVQQEELPLDAKINRGRFEKTAPTVIDGQDLDIPTFMRQRLRVRV